MEMTQLIAFGANLVFVLDIRATNEPKRISCGAPDYVLTRKEIPVGFIESKRHWG